VSNNAVRRHKILIEYEAGQLSRYEAAQVLSVSERQISRLFKKLREGGIVALNHGNMGKTPPNKIPVEVRDRVQELASKKYVNFNYRHLYEMIEAQENLTVSYSSVKRICSALGPPKRARRRKKVHQYRDRHANPGLMLQMDGSDHEWVQGKNWVLVSGIDDATSKVPYGEFFPTEDLNGYLQVLRRVILKEGIPRIIYVDHAAWLSGTTKSDFTGQFKRICEELGITLIFANSPQAKGRIERLWQTFQDRLVSELNYHGISEISQANEFLNRQFLPNTWNEKFTIEPKSPESFYRPGPTDDSLTEIFATKTYRKVRNDHTILWGNRLYRITSLFSYSLAKRQIEIREYSTGLIQGFHAGCNLQLQIVGRVEDRICRSPIPSRNPNVPITSRQPSPFGSSYGARRSSPGASALGGGAL
jgi:transposase